MGVHGGGRDGVLLVVFDEQQSMVAAGIVLQARRLASVGMSAAADEETRCRAIDVVSTIRYTAFLAGPPVLGFLGDQVGVLRALLLVALLLVPSALVVPAARPPARADPSASWWAPRADTPTAAPAPRSGFEDAKFIDGRR